jgi:hypothetical protein
MIDGTAVGLLNSTFTDMVKWRSNEVILRPDLSLIKSKAYS